MSDPAPGHHPIARVVCHSLLMIVGLATAFSVGSGDRQAAARDLPQDYASARAWLDGASAYQPLSELFDRYGFPPPAPDVMVRYNPHPPAAILLTVPFALTRFETAARLVVWTQLIALAFTWVLCYELFRPRIPEWTWATAGGLFGFWAPVWQGLAWGQPVGLLALATLGIWWLARSERAIGFGVLLAATILVRPFVAILIVLACGWSARQQSRAAIGLLGGGLIPFAALQIWPWEWYRVASYAGGYVSGCGSIPGVLNVGATGGMVCFVLAIGIFALLRWYGLPLDTTASLAAVAAMLAYPLAWFQYDTCLLPVIAWVVTRITMTGKRSALWALTAYLLLRTIPDLMPTPNGEGFAEVLARHKNWIQVIARGILLGAVVAVAPRPTTGESMPRQTPTQPTSGTT
jgi:hypothetical protein